MNKRDNIVKWSIISIFVGLYALVSTISTIHVIDFFKLSNPDWLAITLAIAFEIGAAACLGAIIILNKTSKTLVWILFILITLMQMTGNMYYAYSHVQNFQGWAELFGLSEDEPIFQKRILAFISGAILPIVALGFIKSLVDYIRPSEEKLSSYPNSVNDQITDSVTQSIHIEEDDEEEFENPNEALIDAARVWKTVNSLRGEGKLHTPSEEDLENEPTAFANSEYREEEIDDDSLAIIDSFEDTTNEETKERIKEVERKIAKAISKNPDLKDKLSEELKKLESEDKYTKKDESSIANINLQSRTFGGM
jgi:hypothetical protein